MVFPNILPGKYFREADNVWSVLKSDSINLANEELLGVRTGYQVTWMPFSAGDTVPVLAVEGGFLTSNGAVLYAMRAPIGQYTAIGYYDPISIIGHLSHSGMETVTDMELLVLL